MERVKFYSATDLLCGYYLEKSYNIINNYNENKMDYDINEILEFYNIIKYINNKCYLKTWKEKEIEEEKKKIYLPKELTIIDKENLILEYINSPISNLNYLKIIENIQDKNGEFMLHDKTKLLAKKKRQEQISKIFDKNKGMKVEIKVQFSDEKLDEVIRIEETSTNIECIYNINWIKENRDFPTLLNNFIYLFGYVDLQMRITLISKPQELGMFEKHIQVNSRRSYEIGFIFDIKDKLSNLQIAGYVEQMKRLNIRIENIIEWFFKEYLLNEFGVENYKVDLPTEDTKLLEKCKIIIPEIDRILKEYQLFVEYGEINNELLEISSKPILFQNVSILVKDKYVYANSEEFKNISNLFFSDQCILRYVKRIKKNYKSFYDLIANEKIKKEDI